MLAEHTVRIKFDGQPNQVDLTVYTQVLLDFASVVKASVSGADPNADVGVTITAPEQGSFVAVLNLVASQAPGMIHWSVDHLQDLASVVTVATGMYGLHRWASGRTVAEPAEVVGDGNVVIKDIDGSTITIAENVYNVYVTNPRVPEALAHTFSALDDDPAITGFAISDRDAPVFQAEHNEFSAMAQQPQIAAEVSGIEVVTEEAYLYVVKTVLERNYTRKWEFVWSGNKISANIRDEKFFDGLEAHRYSFGAGDVLRVKLDISREFSPQLGTYINRGHSIREVLEFIPSAKDTPML